MAYGSISGTTKNWTDKEIADAKNAGVFFTPANPLPTPKPTTTTVPKTTTNTGFNNPTLGLYNSNNSNKNTNTKPKTTGPQPWNGEAISTPANILKQNTGVDYTKQEKISNTPIQQPVNLPIPNIEQPNTGIDYQAFLNALNKLPQQQPQQQPINLPTPQFGTGAILPQYQSQYNKQIQDTLGKLSNLPSYTTPKYQNQYQGDINSLLQQLQGLQQFQFNDQEAMNSPYIKALQDKAVGQVQQDLGRRNMLDSSINDTRTAEAVANILATQLPQMRQQQMQEYQLNKGNLLDQLQALTQRENVGYGQYRDTVGDTQREYNTNKDNLSQLIQLLNQQDSQGYGQYRDNVNDVRYIQDRADNLAQKDFSNKVALENLRTQNTGYYNPYFNQDIDPQALQYAKDYQAEINRRRATPDPTDDTLISSLEAARANKILSSPDLTQKYGDAYMTPQQRQANIEVQLRQRQMELAADPNNPENQIKQIELQKAMTELRNLQAIDPTFQNKESQLKLAKLQADIEQSRASAASSYASASKAKSEATNEQKGNLTYKDYVDMGRKMLDAGTYDNIAGEYIAKNNPQDIINWVKGLNLTPEQKAKLANDLGLKK